MISGMIRDKPKELKKDKLRKEKMIVERRKLVTKRNKNFTYFI